MAASSSSLPLPPESPPPPLETLVSYLVASKRSLSSIEQVWQANEIVTSTRKSLETSVITSSRTSFLCHGIRSQLLTLEQILFKSREVETEGVKEYQEALRNLEAAEGRLTTTLDRLRSTIVETELRPDTEEKSSLLDFVDESGVDKLLEFIKESTKAADGAHDEFADTNKTFSKGLEQVREHLIAARTEEGKAVVKDDPDTLEDEASIHSPLPEILNDMEERAKGMADNLESLVKHFDLCVTAIKHTEGGGDAAQRIANDLPEGMGMGQDDVQAPSEPISDEERNEMLKILEKDAEQVEEVVMEIRESFTRMENQHSQVKEHLEELEEQHGAVLSAFRILEAIAARLSAFISQSEVFVMRWDSEKTKFDEYMEELETLRSFYDGFLGAYDNLLVEVGRRQFMEQRMEKLALDAMTKVDRLYEEDVAAREAFKREQGDFLPVDIWPGLMDSPLRPEMSPVDGGLRRAPDISKSVIQRAIRRVSGRG
ncbi:MAG: hypothetical protein Q9190_007882 [Brigantiaea leucoxantha]